MQIKSLSVFLIFFILLPSVVSAVHVPDIQKKIDITIERGREYSFNLLLKNLTTTTTISSSGNTSGWVTFGENNEDEYLITNLVDQSLKVTIFIPSSAETGHYTALVKANNETISEINIEVIVQISDVIKSLEQEIENLKSNVNDLEEEQSELKSKTNVVAETQERIKKVQETIEELVKSLNRKIDDMEKYQKDLHELESTFNQKKAELESQLQQLQQQAEQLEEQNKQLNELTGSLTLRETSFKILLAIIVVGIALSIFMPEQKKVKIANKVKEKIPFKVFKKRKEEGKKYRFTVRE
jgi:uncharacterized phage infection (PIP) family protein YhgE